MTTVSNIQPERLQAGIYLLFYTLLASLPLLVGIFYIYYSDNSIFFIINTFYGLPVKILKALLPSSILATCPAHLNLLDLITLTILGGRGSNLFLRNIFQVDMLY